MRTQPERETVNLNRVESCTEIINKTGVDQACQCGSKQACWSSHLQDKDYSTDLCFVSRRIVAGSSDVLRC